MLIARFLPVKCMCRTSEPELEKNPNHGQRLSVQDMGHNQAAMARKKTMKIKPKFKSEGAGYDRIVIIPTTSPPKALSKTTK